MGTDAVVLGASMSLPERGEAPLNCLDIGCGTGIIALMAAQRCADAGLDVRIDAIDIDAPSCEEASLNCAASPWAEHLSVRCIALQEMDGRYDFIFSNPPYYDRSLLNPDRRESRARHSESLEFEDIARFAAAHLQPRGQLSLIVPYELEASLVKLMKGYGLSVFRILRIRTTESKDVRRVVLEFRFSALVSALEEEELVLQDGNVRSEAYERLTEEFYL